MLAWPKFTWGHTLYVPLLTRVNSPIIDTYPDIGMFTDYQIHLVLWLEFGIKKKYNVIFNLWRKYCGKKNIVIFKIWSETKWHLINLRSVTIRSRSGHFYSSGLIMFYPCYVNDVYKNRWMLNGKLIKNFQSVIKLGCNFMFWKLIPMTVIGIWTTC